MAILFVASPKIWYFVLAGFAAVFGGTVAVSYTHLDVYKRQIIYSVPGKFSVYNALAAIAAGVVLNVPMDIIIKGIKEVKGVKGRFEPVKTYNDITAIVDYSHTPDSLENMLNTAREFVKGRIITVFGCGGDRDKLKRPIMG